MLTKERTKAIFKLSFPISIALSSTLMMSVIDLAMVGRLGNNAVAAVGLAVFSYTLVLAFVKGIAPAVQGLVARRRGEGSTEPKCLPLNGGLLLAIAVGMPLATLFYFISPFLFPLISSDPEVTKIGVPFLRILYLAIAAVGMNNSFQGYWAGMERPKVFMLIVLFMNGVNIVLNYILIFGHFGAPALGATGAAIGTVLSVHVGLILNLVITRFRFDIKRDGFLTVKPQLSLLAHIAKLGLPATLQEFFYSLGSVVLFWMIGKVGTAELAASNVLIRITMVLTLLAISLGMASATLVSKSVGEGDPSGAAQWGWDTGKLGIIGLTLVGLPLLLFPRLFLSIFLTDPYTLSMAVIPLRLIAGTIGTGSLIYIFAYTLYSVGDGKRVMMVSFGTQWLLFLPGVWIVGPYLRYGLLQIWLVGTAYGAIATILITTIWADGKWKRIKI